MPGIVKQIAAFSRSSPKPRPQFSCCHAVTLQAKSPHVGKVALSPAFRNRYDVVRIPQRFPALFRQPPLSQEFPPRREIQPTHVTPQRNGIHRACRADSGIARQHALAQVAWIGAEFPLVNACVRTKRAAPRRSFGAAPPAQGPA